MKDNTGKLDHQLFEQIIHSHNGYRRSEVRVGPAFGVDVSVIDLPGGLSLAATSDPLSLIPSLGLEESAWLSVHLMANDMATTGFAPMYGQFVLNLPQSFSQSDFAVYWNYIHRFCSSIGTAITGGHTGFVEGQSSTIAGGGTFFTIAPRGALKTSRDARPGNTLLLTKQCAISASSILAMSFPETVKNKLGQETYQEACSLFYQTSSLSDALTAAGQQIPENGVTAMHDVTEGGVLGAIYELSIAAGCGALIFNDRLPVGWAVSQVCSLFSLDPRCCIGAGSMIIACEEEKAAAIIERLNSNGISCCAVGTLTEKDHDIRLVGNNGPEKLAYHDKDPYWAAFYTAIHAGWK